MTAQPHHSAPLIVGREREQAILRDALAAALAGRGSVVLIGGEAGIGKTTLAEAVLAEANNQGALVLVGRCFDLAETPPYGPWAEALGQLEPVPEVLPALGGAVAIASQAALFARVREELAGRAAQQFVVVLLDDLHWADLGSLDLLRSLARGLGGLPILVIATYRADELTRRHPLYALLPALVREARATRLDLRSLEEEAMRTLVAARYGLSPGDEARLVAYLRDHAEGNPFYAGELLRTLEETRTLHTMGGQWQLRGLGGARVPVLLRQVIDGRLARLGEEAWRLLGVAAVIGQVVPHDLWRAVAEASDDALIDAAERAVEARVLVESPADGGYCFAHALIREALYEGLLLPRRRAWHRRAGEALAAMVSPDPDAVAYHFQRAGDARAAEWLIAAGERARRTYAWLTAAGHYEAALAVMAKQGTDAVVQARALHMIALLRRYSDRPRAVALLAEATALARGGGDPALAAAASFDRGHLLCLAGDYAIGLPAMRAALPVLAALPSEQLAALPTTVVLGIRPGEDYHRGVLLLFLAFSGHLAEVEEIGADALVLAPGSGHRALLAAAVTHDLRGEPGRQARALDAALAVARAAGQHTEVAILLTFVAGLLFTYRTDDLAARAALAAEVAAVLPAVREADPDLTATQALSLLRLVEGAWHELAGWGAAHPERLPVVQIPLAQLRGDAASVRTRVRALLPDGPATAPGSVSLYPALLAQQASAHQALALGDLSEARAWLDAHDRWLAWSGATLNQAEGHANWAAYHRAAGEPALARAHAERALARAMEPRQPLALLAVHRLLGKLDIDAGQLASARTHLDAALALADACAAPYERALTLLALAELQLAQGDRANAATRLDDARAVLERLGAHPALARAEALVTQLAAPGTPAPTLAYPAGLSAREAEVLRLVAQGLSNAQAAERLYLSPRTVDQHLRSIYGKLGVDNRTAASRWAAQHGLVGEAP